MNVTGRRRPAKEKTMRRTMLLTLAVSLMATLSLFAADGAKPVATIGKTAITQADLDAAVGRRMTGILPD
jgi:hypothetical protein